MVSDRNSNKKYMILDETENIILGVTDDAPQRVREKLIVIAVQQFGLYGDNGTDLCRCRCLFCG